ncbi:hypothetical protein D6821_01885 [Candidatus Parcubacteria bacterium]|nr:MAG: hypothetical protein D6821_01885 [Candidatus Parcubacteria bacterium]
MATKGQITSKEKINWKIIFFQIVSVLAIIAYFGLANIYLSSQSLAAPDKQQNTNLLQTTAKHPSAKPQLDYSDPFITKRVDMGKRRSAPDLETSDPYWGNPNAKVVVVMFADFGCRYCQKQSADIKKLLDKFGAQAAFVWKDYPDFDRASLSWQASVAGRCAQRQNKFWQVYGELYNFQPNQNFLRRLAEKYDLDWQRFWRCYSRQETAELILQNIAEANELEIYGVPFIYVGSKEFFGQITLSDLEQAIQKELEKVDSK